MERAVASERLSAAQLLELEAALRNSFISPPGATASVEIAPRAPPCGKPGLALDIALCRTLAAPAVRAEAYAATCRGDVVKSAQQACGPACARLGSLRNSSIGGGIGNSALQAVFERSRKALRQSVPGFELDFKFSWRVGSRLDSGFERFVGIRHAATACNGTVALHLALAALGLALAAR